MSDLLDKYLAHYDPLHLGLARRGIANGVHLTQGRVFPRVDGGYNLYHGLTRAGLDLVSPVGAAPAWATSVTPFSWIGFEDGIHFFELRAIGPGGVESVRDPANVVKVLVEAGEAIAPVPPAPRDLAVTPLSGGRLRVSWSYAPSAAFARATSFAIYSDGGTGVMDEVTPVATKGVVGARGGEGVYAYESEAFSHGDTVRYLVRARTVDDREEQNNVTAAAIADAEGPGPALVTDVEYGADE